MTEHLLKLVGVSESYSDGGATIHALSNVDLTVDRGEMVAIMGPSGSGKSTLLSAAGGLLVPTSGIVAIDGARLDGLSAKNLAVIRRRVVGFVFQDFNLLAALTALENVALPLELDGVSPRKARRLALHSLGLVGLAQVVERYPAELSGGQQQRVAIARAVVGQRSLLLADEPTGALDSAAGEVVMQAIRSRVDAGAGCVIVTHDPRQAAWADRIVFLRDGRVVDQSQPATGISEFLANGNEAR